MRGPVAPRWFKVISAVAAAVLATLSAPAVWTGSASAATQMQVY